jgi:1-aminocyclopropane-1-carboxylate deaminase
MTGSPGRTGRGGSSGSTRLEETRAQVAKIARATAELIELGRELREDEITVLAGWAGDCYGIPVPSTLEAIRLTGSLGGQPALNAYSSLFS